MEFRGLPAAFISAMRHEFGAHGRRTCLAAALFLNASLICATSSIPADTQNPVPRFERTTCDDPVPGNLPPDITRECGHLIVPEIRGRAGGRTFRIAVVRYPAREPDGSPPLLLLHGGPAGEGGTRSGWAPLQYPLARRRDIVASDMRGVGGSIVQRFLEDPMHAPDASCITAMRTVQFKTRGFDPLLTLIITDTSKSRPARRLK